MMNEAIRKAARLNDVKLWQIADYLNINPSTLTVWLRHELSPEKEQSMMDAIKAIAAQR